MSSHAKRPPQNKQARMSLFGMFLTLCSLWAMGATASAQVPVFERIEPTSGPVGTEVQIIGRRFAEDSKFYLNNVELEIVRKLPNRWTVRITAGAPSGRVAARYMEGGQSRTALGPEFRVINSVPAPVITNVSPLSGPPGTVVTLTGQNFSPRLTENVVTLGSAPTTLREATPFALRVVVPEGALSGVFTVRVGQAGQAVSTQNFTVLTPTAITAFAPAIGAPGTRVTIDGTGFSANARQNRVYLGNVVLRVEQATTTRLVVVIPANARSGAFMVDVSGAGRATSAAQFKVQLQPTITSFSVPAGPPGTQVTLTGTNFGDDLRVITAMLGNAPLALKNLIGGALTVEIPADAVTGRFTVTVNTIAGTSATDFVVLPRLAITDFNPKSGPIGTILTLTGTGFAAVSGQNQVTLAGKSLAVVSSSATEVRVRIAPATSSGPIQLAVAYNGQAATTTPFVVTTPPRLVSFAPTKVAPGGTFVVTGSAFGTNASTLEVKVGETLLQVVSVTDTQLTVQVPANLAPMIGRLTVNVRLQGSAVSAANFEVLALFGCAAIEPASGYIGTTITLRGQGFAAGGMGIQFTGMAKTVAATYVGPQELRVMVPAGAAAGPVTIRHPDGRSVTSATAFTVTPMPTGVGISSLQPACTRPGCSLIVQGWGFSTKINQNRVFFGTFPVRVLRATPSELELSLPARPGTEAFKIDVRRVGVANTGPFTITP